MLLAVLGNLGIRARAAGLTRWSIFGFLGACANFLTLL